MTLPRSPSGAPYPQGTVSLPAASIAAGASATITAASPGAQIGDHVIVSQRVALDAGLAATAGVFAADVVAITVTNPTAGAITPGAIRVMSWIRIPFATT